MYLYQAPLEGITGYIFRKAIYEVFGGIDKYFAPFISPYEKRIVAEKEINQLCPEHNIGYKLVPQILSMDYKGTIELIDWLYENFGYDEFNLNFGCPSGTVVSKGRGAGALKNLDILEKYLDYIFTNTNKRISIKTRIGLHNIDEFESILSIYNKYQFEELIIHPRVKDELYKGLPHKDIYHYAENNSVNPLIYNGNIFSVGDYENISKDIGSQTIGIMIGRGMISNPAIYREIKGGEPMSKDELSLFLHIIMDSYLAEFSGETPVLHKMKEIWSYLGDNLVTTHNISEKTIKKIKKSKNINEYKAFEREALSTYD